jgi:DNA-directed RNA polymerase specialized sigma24 family protein
MTRQQNHSDTESSALAEQVEARYPELFRTACLILGDASAAEHVTTTAMRRAWRFRHTFRDDDSSPWLYRVLVSACYRWERQRRSAPSKVALPSGTRAPGAMESALSQLSMGLRVPFVLAYFANLNEKQIAVATATRESTVAADVRTARHRIGELLESTSPVSTTRLRRADRSDGHFNPSIAEEEAR